MDKPLDFKKKIREEVLNKRRELSNKDIQARSKKICKQLINLEEFRECKSVLIFVSMPDEVQTKYLFRSGFDQKKLLAAPIVQKSGEPLLLSVLSESHIRELLSEKADGEHTNWTMTRFGILEPRRDTVNPVAISEIELIVVPGLGFDRDGMRVGFGGGHYDRLLAKANESTLAVAIAFDFQIYHHITYCAHDQRVDMIVTEREVIKPK